MTLKLIAKPNHGPAEKMARYIEYARTGVPTFGRWWTAMDEPTRARKQDLLLKLAGLADRIPHGRGWPYDIRLKESSDAELRRCMRLLEDREMGGSPDPAFLTSLSRDTARLEQMRQNSERRLRKALAVFPAGAIGFYGGLKDRAAVEEKIARCTAANSWQKLRDMVRWRVVCETLSGVGVVAATICNVCGPVLRGRNYFTVPRNQDDLYRAIHIVLPEADGMVEIQVLSEAREVVCELDHGLKYKRDARLLRQSDLSWLLRLSLAANLLDVSNGLWQTCPQIRAGWRRSVPTGQHLIPGRAKAA